MLAVADQIRATDAAEEAAAKAAEEALFKDDKRRPKSSRGGGEATEEENLAVIRGETEIYRRLEKKCVLLQY